MIVDDDAMVREATAWTLTDAGHEVIEAADGVDALEYLQDHAAVDLIITDISMPRMNGLDLVDEVQLRWPGLPVLLVSGRPQPKGTRAFMSKPFNAQALLLAVAQLVEPSAEPGTRQG